MDDSPWVAIDWGTTHLRAWLMSGHQATAEAHSARGMGKLAPEAFEQVLIDLVSPWLEGRNRTLVLACGMIGARQGWIEAPYVATPAPPGHPNAAVTVPVRDDRIDVRILPGLCQRQPADVMRGEETQIAGLLLEQPAFAGVVCLPGTHSKWVRVKGGRVESFQTYMTGEMFELLSRHSVLRHSVAESGWDDAAFSAGFRRTVGDPAALAVALFAIRAQDLLQSSSPVAARASLSGMLVGAEFAGSGIAAAVGPVALIGGEPLTRIYLDAFNLIGVDPLVVDAETATLRGLCAAHDKLVQDRP